MSKASQEAAGGRVKCPVCAERQRKADLELTWLGMPGPTCLCKGRLWVSKGAMALWLLENAP